MGKYQKLPYYGTLNEAGREEDLRLAGEDWSPKKWVEAGMNYGSWRLIDRSGKNSQTTYVPKETTDSIIIIIHTYMYQRSTAMIREEHLKLNIVETLMKPLFM